MTTGRLPTYYISHGGGPWPWLVDMLPYDTEPLARSLRAMASEIGVTPKAILMVSGHWETDVPTVQTNPNPGMLYDYGGFPAFTYEVQYSAPGSPAVASRVAELLTAAGIAVHEDADRGFDHGVFAPLAVAFPEAEIPVLQLSILHSYDPAAHLAIGRALAPLRDEGVLIVGSGLSYHNLRLMGAAGTEPSRQFDEWLTDATTKQTGDERNAALVNWEQAPSARIAHPAEDHLIPLMVAVGAAEGDVGVQVYHEDDFFGAVHASSYRFGIIA